MQISISCNRPIRYTVEKRTDSREGECPVILFCLGLVLLSQTNHIFEKWLDFQSVICETPLTLSLLKCESLSHALNIITFTLPQAIMLV